MFELGTIFKIAGIAIGSALLEKLMESQGHGDKRGFVRIVAYLACAGIAIDETFDYMRRLGARFGVFF